MIIGDQDFIDAVRARVRAHDEIACLLIDEDENQPNTDPQIQRERKLLKFCRRNGILVWITVMSPGAGFRIATHPLLRDEARKTQLFRKHNFMGELDKPEESAFRGTVLKSALAEHKIDTLLVVGAFYGSCIRATVRDAIDGQLCSKILLCGELVRGPRPQPWHNQPGFAWYDQLGALA